MFFLLLCMPGCLNRGITFQAFHLLWRKASRRMLNKGLSSLWPRWIALSPASPLYNLWGGHQEGAFQEDSSFPLWFLGGWITCGMGWILLFSNVVPARQKADRRIIDAIWGRQPPWHFNRPSSVKSPVAFETLGGAMKQDQVSWSPHICHFFSTNELFGLNFSPHESA